MVKYMDIFKKIYPNLFILIKIVRLFLDFMDIPIFICEIEQI